MVEYGMIHTRHVHANLKLCSAFLQVCNDLKIESQNDAAKLEVAKGLVNIKCFTHVPDTTRTHSDTTTLTRAH